MEVVAFHAKPRQYPDIQGRIYFTSGFGNVSLPVLAVFHFRLWQRFTSEVGDARYFPAATSAAFWRHSAALALSCCLEYAHAMLR
jgi:hypothetical protein